MRVNRKSRSVSRIEMGMVCVLAISVAACGEDTEPTISTDVTSSFVTQENASPVENMAVERVEMDLPEASPVPVDFPYEPGDDSADTEPEDNSSDDTGEEGAADEETWNEFTDDINKREQFEVVVSRGLGAEQLVDGDHQSSSKFDCRNEVASVSFKFADPKKLSMLLVASDLSFSHPTSIKLSTSMNGNLWRELGVFNFDTVDTNSRICGDGETSFGGQACSLDNFSIRYDVFSDFATTEARLVRLSIKSEDCESMKMVLNEIEFF